jgi:small subunit ribosomal protein S6
MHHNKKHYEVYFILTPMLNKQQLEKALDKFTSVLTTNNAEIINTTSYGLKKLAYKIDGKSTGFCELIQFTAPPEIIKILEIEFKRDEKVLRFLTTILDKHAVQYNKEKSIKDAEKKAATDKRENENIESQDKQDAA